MFEGMNDVTNKVAYAYSKQQAFALVALLVGGAAVALAYAERASIVLLVGDAALLAGAAAIAALIVGRSNLAKVNRPALRASGLAFLVKLATLAVALVLFRGSVHDLAGDVAALLFLVGVMFSYPLPIRRAGGVLYGPAEVRDLSDGRAIGTGAMWLGALTIGASAFPGSPAESLGLLPSHWVVDVALLGLAVAFAGVFLRTAQRTRRNAGIGLFAATALLGLLVGVAPVLVYTGLAGIVVLTVLGPRLTSGKRIISHRA
jgi:hypothetical protein